MYDSDQIEVAMARTRENERITKIRNDQHRDSLLAAALKLQEKEKKRKEALKKSQKIVLDLNSDMSIEKPEKQEEFALNKDIIEVEQLNDADDKSEISTDTYKYVDNGVIAFQSLVPMKTLLFDLTNALLTVGKLMAKRRRSVAVRTRVGAVSCFGSGSNSFTGTGSGIVGSFGSGSDAIERCESDAVDRVCQIKGSQTGEKHASPSFLFLGCDYIDQLRAQRGDNTAEAGKDGREVGGQIENGISAVKPFCPMKRQNGRKIRGNSSREKGIEVREPLKAACSVNRQLEKVLLDPSFLLVILKELSLSDLNLQNDLKIALRMTKLMPQVEAVPSNVSHCQRGNCRGEIFEIYVLCPACGFLCLNCASGGGDVNVGGCVLSNNRSGHNYEVSSTQVSTDKVKDETTKVSIAVNQNMAVAVDTGVCGNTEYKRGQSQAPVNNLQGKKTYACWSEFNSDPAYAGVKSEDVHTDSFHHIASDNKIKSEVDVEVGVKCILTTNCVEDYHEHAYGAKIVLKSPLNTTHCIVQDFANLILTLHPTMRDAVQKALGDQKIELKSTVRTYAT